MTSFVISDQTLAALSHDTVFLFGTDHDSLDGITDFVIADFSELTTGGQDRGFVQQVGEVSTRVTGGTTRHLVEVDIFRQRLAASMNAQNLQTTGVVRAIDRDLTIKATRTHQGCIKHIRTVGRRNDDDACVALKAIHLGEELVEGLLALVIATA